MKGTIRMEFSTTYSSYEDSVEWDRAWFHCCNIVVRCRRNHAEGGVYLCRAWLPQLHQQRRLGRHRRCDGTLDRREGKGRRSVGTLDHREVKARWGARGSRFEAGRCVLCQPEVWLTLGFIMDNHGAHWTTGKLRCARFSSRALRLLL